MTLDMRRGALLSPRPSISNSPDMHRPGFAACASYRSRERAVGLQLIQLEVEDGEVEVTLEASFEGMELGLVSERPEQDLGVWRTQLPARASPWRPHRRRRSMATIFRRPPSTN